MFDEEDLLPLSALQHLIFCERQFALIHLERVWLENVLTAEGREMHERVEGGGHETRGSVRIARDLQIRSLAHGLIGKADIVEFHADPGGIGIPGWTGSWRPYPVEYKRGRPKAHRADEAQLCAQAICLEEMLATAVPSGALFYGKTRRRVEVTFGRDLRELVARAASRCRHILADGVTPTARLEPKCEHCSLLTVCRPEVLGRSAVNFVERSVRQNLESFEEGR